MSFNVTQPPSSSSAASRQLVSVLDHILDTSVHDSYALEPEEFAWSKLPGRCCYDVNRPTCNVCKYWGSADDFCHRSKGHCSENCSPRNPPDAVDEDGNPLPELPPLTYCEGAPPPLVDGGKVCVGGSRINEPCMDELNSGKCTSFGMLTCQAHCWWTPGCALFTVYSVLDSGDNMDGSCVLCYDMHHHVTTPNFHTRTFRYTQPTFVLPPAPPSQPSPSPPPKPPPPPPPPAEDAVLAMGGENMAACTFYAPYELTYAPDTASASDKQTAKAAAATSSAMATARVEHTENATSCCSSCATDQNCTGFVYEHASRVCVVLPPAKDLRLVPRYNGGMTSGFVRRYTSNGLSPPPSPPPAQCRMTRDQGYGGVRDAKIGPGIPPHGQLMASAEICCGVCAANPECTKFTFTEHAWAPGVGDCMLFTPIAEPFKKAGEGLISGTVIAKDIEEYFIEPPTPPHLAGRPMPSPPPEPPEFPRMAELGHQGDRPQFADAGDKHQTAIMWGAISSFLGAGLVIFLVVRSVFCSANSTQVTKFTPVSRSGRAAPKKKSKLKALTMARAAVSDSEDDEDENSEDEMWSDEDDEDDEEARPRRSVGGSGGRRAPPASNGGRSTSNSNTSRGGGGRAAAPRPKAGGTGRTPQSNGNSRAAGPKGPRQSRGGRERL